MKNLKISKKIKELCNDKESGLQFKIVSGFIAVATVAGIVATSIALSKPDSTKTDTKPVTSSSISVDNSTLEVIEEKEEVKEEIKEEVKEEGFELEVMTEGEFLYNVKYLNDKNNYIFNSLSNNIKPLYKDTPANEEILKDTLLVLNGFKPLKENYSVNMDLTYAISNLFGMEKIQVNTTKNKSYLIDKTKILSANSEGNKIISFLNEHVNQIMTGDFTDFKHFEEDVNTLVKGFEGVYEYNFIQNEENVCEPALNPNHKEENIVVLNHNEVCGKSINIDLSKLTDGEIHTIALTMQAGMNSYYTSIDVSEAIFMEKVMLVYPVLNDSAFHIQENLSKYLEYDKMSKEDDGKRLIDVLNNQYLDITKGSASALEKEAYLENIFITIKKLHGNLDTLLIVDEKGECRAEENERRCEPTNIITFYDDATTPVRVEVEDKKYVSLAEKFIAIDIIMDTLNNNSFKNTTIKTKDKENKEVVITTNQLVKSTKLLLNSLIMERNKQIIFQNNNSQKTLR